ncbi:hypothetical protein CKO11_16970 [Rhodobacter sp. TJ_12]|uniref:META domain-containing protein n=1 Tax=Rhodobacter sp. TJ_12 TaxID=2029399 RepID=UPI001CBC408D|nr:META domain-containing protein [Rhodobacter sp. TJ_12]MBZ4024140.1 hypothetical protein [Rhodobacter sp. TJ_12]
MRPILLLALILGLAACKEDDAQTVTDPHILLQQAAEWQVFDIAGMVVPQGVVVTLATPETGVIAGSAGCNRYSARIEMRGDQLHIGAPTGTRMMCPPAQMEVEQAFHSTIGRAKGMRLRGETLELTDAAGAPLIRARP